MNNIRFSFTRTSGNRKTGPIAVSMTSRNSCPDSCALKANGCYAESGMVRLHWQKLDQQTAGYDLAQFVGLISSLPTGAAFRHNVAGDIPDLHHLMCISKAAQSRNLEGWTYTHNHSDEAMRNGIAYVNTKQGLTVNLSANSPKHADELLALTIGPVVTVVSPDTWKDDKPISKTSKGNTIVRCPAEYIEGMDCDKCRLCAVSTRRGIVGFTAHGVAKRKVIALVKA